MDDIQNDVFDDNHIVDDSLSDNNDNGMEENGETEPDQVDTEEQDTTTTTDYSDILTDINSNIENVYEYITGQEVEEITLADIHKDMHILTSVLLLFMGYMIMRSLVYKIRRM